MILKLIQKSEGTETGNTSFNKNIFIFAHYTFEYLKRNKSQGGISFLTFSFRKR